MCFADCINQVHGLSYIIELHVIGCECVWCVCVCVFFLCWHFVYNNNNNNTFHNNWNSSRSEWTHFNKNDRQISRTSRHACTQLAKRERWMKGKIRNEALTECRKINPPPPPSPPIAERFNLVTFTDSMDGTWGWLFTTVLALYVYMLSHGIRLHKEHAANNFREQRPHKHCHARLNSFELCATATQLANCDERY